MSGIDIVLLLIGLAAVGGGWFARRRGVALQADRMYAGLIPGLTPAPGHQAASVPVPSGGAYAGEVAVAFTPPRDMAPGVGGVVVDDAAEARDVTATVLDLAVRGWLAIKPLDVDGRRDWELTQRPSAPHDTLRPFEQRLLAELFREGSVATLGGVARRPDRPLAYTRDDLRAAAWDAGWYMHVGAPSYVRAGIVLVALVAGWLLLTTGRVSGLLATVLVIVGAVLAYRGFAPRDVRSADGTAARIQLLGFKKYLDTAEAEQFSFEEAAGIFSRYLPWAIVFGVAAHWAKVFADIATHARDENIDLGGDLDWFSTYLVADMLTDVAFFAMLSDIDALGGLDDLGSGLGDGGGFDGFDFFGDGGGGDLGGDGGGFDVGSFFGGGGDGGGGFDFGDFGGDF